MVHIIHLYYHYYYYCYYNNIGCVMVSVLASSVVDVVDMGSILEYSIKDREQRLVGSESG
jgi:hypothetical protein